MERERICTLCGNAVDKPRSNGPAILLIGLSDQEAVRRRLMELGAAGSFLTCRDTREAVDALRRWGGGAFFLLDAGLGETACLEFLAWLLKNRPTYGAIIGDSISNGLAINGLNSQLVVDALLRPVPVERWRRMLERCADTGGEDRQSALAQLKGSAPNWYE